MRPIYFLVATLYAPDGEEIIGGPYKNAEAAADALEAHTLNHGVEARVVALSETVEPKPLDRTPLTPEQVEADYDAWRTWFAPHAKVHDEEDAHRKEQERRFKRLPSNISAIQLPIAVNPKDRSKCGGKCPRLRPSAHGEPSCAWVDGEGLVLGKDVSRHGLCITAEYLSGSVPKKAKA